jgi:hypothetical protein
MSGAMLGPVGLRLGLLPWPGFCSPGPGRRGHGCGAAVPHGGGGGAGAERASGSGVMAGHQGWAVPIRAGAGEGPLAPGAREDKGLGSVTPMMVTTIGRAGWWWWRGLSR